MEVEAASLTGLHRAVWTHDVDEVQRLVDSGADVSEIVLIHGRPYDPLDLVWQGHHVDHTPAVACIDILVAGGLVLTFDHLYKKIGSPPNMFKALLDHGAPIRPCPDDLDLDLHILLAALRTSYTHPAHAIEKTRLLLERGADPNEPMSFNYMAILPTVPLHMAIYESNLEAIYVLLEHGADPYVVDTFSGVTSLGWARHMAAYYKTKPIYDSTSTRIVQFIEHVYECRNLHERHWEALKKELIEAVFHPVRLQKLEYFVIRRHIL